MVVSDWYKRNKARANTTLISAGIFGVTAALLCFAFPGVLPFLASTTVLGWAPLVFLTKAPILLACVAVGLMVSSLSLIGLSCAAFIQQKVKAFAQHSSTLWGHEERQALSPVAEESYKKLLQSSLQPCKYPHYKAYRTDEFVLANCPRLATEKTEVPPLALASSEDLNTSVLSCSF
ncbi:hypothetical protein [Legionella sp. km772]|uniref:hypothetical protein n=1 Tax=Legionella sp. km772 TaxID=2498111 RepID=UPI000F8D84A5|nr:hypothetical protein [Legionella sp. km772]